MGRKPEIIFNTGRTYIEAMLQKAENNNLYSIQAESNGFGYVYDDGWLAIITPQGSIRMSLDKATQFGKDLTEVTEELKDLVERRIV